MKRLHGPDHPEKERSPHWRAAALEHLRKHPGCQVCGLTHQVQVHHLEPYHERPDLELDPANLLTLCQGENTADHHQWFGHLGDFRCVNRRCAKWCRAVQSRKPT